MRRAYIGIAVAVLVVALAAALQWLTGTGALLESTRARVVDEATRTLGREVRPPPSPGIPSAASSSPACASAVPRKWRGRSSPPRASPSTSLAARPSGALPRRGGTA